MSRPKLLEFAPNDTVCFSPQEATLKGVLTIKNISSHVVVFKVKTTNPRRYQVRPFMSMLAPNEERVVTFTIGIESEAKDFIAQCKQQEKEQRSPVAFLIMSLKLEEELAMEVMSATQDSLAARLQQLWKEKEQEDVERGKKSFESKKLYAAHWDGSDGDHGPSCEFDATDSSKHTAGFSGDDASIRTTGGAVSPAPAASTELSPVLQPTPVDKPEARAVPPEAMLPTTASTDRSKPQRIISPPAPPAAVPAGHSTQATPVAKTSTPTAQAQPSRQPQFLQGSLTPDEAYALREKVNDLAASVLVLTKERNTLVQAVTEKDREVQKLNTRLKDMEKEQQTAAVGSRPKKSTDDDDMEIADASGFPLWQVIVIAIISLLIGRLLSAVL